MQHSNRENRKNKRLGTKVDAGSMADIAFLLLIFFLVTTTINSEKGIMARLPPWEETPPEGVIIDRNLLSVKINADNQLLVEGERSDLENLRGTAKEFIENPEGRVDLPRTPRNAIISLQNDRNTSYHAYLAVYNELKGAYNEVWNEKSHTYHKMSYDQLGEQAQKKIRDEYPLVISEAEPTDYGVE